MLRVLVLLVAVCAGREVEEFSIFCTSLSCQKPKRGRIHGATAFGSFDDQINATGWGTLFMGSEGSDLAEVAFGAGYLEGFLTADRIMQMSQNYKSAYDLESIPTALSDFLSSNDAWVQRQLVQSESTDPYWGAVRFLYSQTDGLVTGVNSRFGEQRLTREDALLLNLQGDIEELLLALNVSSRPDFGSMTLGEIERWELARSHCSALVKLLPDGSDLFTGHNMWWGYYAMLRVFKHYSFPRILGGRLAPASFSSYPGILASTDDFYQMGSKLVVMETTTDVFDMTLYHAVGPESLFYWVRAMTSNYLARNGSEWMNLFQRHNSGTYNNMWMVVDYNRFIPGQELQAGILTVGEQLPGYFHFEDQTHVLSYGYWPSYNRALYPETAQRCGQNDMVAKHGKYFSYQFTARAEVFRRDQGSVLNEDDMKRILRSNKFQTDPLAEGKPCWQLACRGDLQELPDANGAIDGKFTTRERVMRGETIVVAGPTHDDQSVFDWRTAPAQVKAEKHVGQPLRFDFDWVTMGPFNDSFYVDTVLV